MANFFDFNNDAPSFEQFGAAKAELQRCAAVVRGSATKAQRQLAAARAAALAFPTLVKRAKLPKNDAAALLAVMSVLAPLASAPRKLSAKRRSGRPKPAEKITRQALAIIGVDWLTKLKHGALSKQEARKRVAAQIPADLLEPGAHREWEKRRPQITQIEQLGRWEEAFATKKDYARHQALLDANNVLKDEWRAKKCNALNYSADKVLSRVKRALIEK